MLRPHHGVYLFVLLVIGALTHPIAAQTKPATEPAAVDVLPATFAEIPYGPEPAQKVWFWQAKSDKPAPLIVKIHGGGWIHGPREVLSPRDKFYLDRGISIASITYTLTPVKPLPAPVMDAARALQFLRSKAEEWKIDSSRVMVIGFSAGGCTAIWLATHDDLADPQAADPVLRQSTRVSGAIGIGAQTTIEPELVRQAVGEGGVKHPMFRSAFGFRSNEEMFAAIAQKPDVAKRYAEFSPINHLSPDDPPILLQYREATLGDGGVHGGGFGLKFLEKAKALGMNQCYVEAVGNDQCRGYPGGARQFVSDILRLSGTPNK